MSLEETIRKLAGLTDVTFERLTTAVLREANPEYCSLIHTGVNPDGKIIKGPLDGIAFVGGAQPPRMIVAHHTTCTLRDLRKKWLHDPSAVTPRKRNQPAAPAGDLLKAVEIIDAERARRRDLYATMVLTTNCEPSEELVRDAHAAVAVRNIDIDIWSVTRIAHFLDNNPQGQWLRRKHLGIEQERLSRDLLSKLSRDSLNAFRPQDQTEAWVPRHLDHVISAAKKNGVTFVVAESGLGKSVACYKRLEEHVDAGGFGLVIPDDILTTALTVTQAVDATLLRLYPSLLPNSGAEAEKFCNPEHPLLLIVEDISRSGQPAFLADKIIRWASTAKDNDNAAMAWRLLCPVWPQVFSSLSDESRKRLEALTILGETFSLPEGREAVKRRSRMAGKTLSDLDADSIAAALGYDPLLIALHLPGSSPDSDTIIARYVDGSAARVAEKHVEYPAVEYWSALRELADELILLRQVNPLWSDVTKWLTGRADVLTRLRHLVFQREVIRLDDNSRLAFRHDRVRDALFADAVAERMRGNNLDESVLADPYFADVIGIALLRRDIPLSVIERVRNTNPLPLFHALRRFREPKNNFHEEILTSINHWLTAPTSHDLAYTHLRWAALAALSETESSCVRPLLRKFRDRTWTVTQARFRNGDLLGGVQLCLEVEPGVGSPWRDRQIAHAKMRFGRNLRLGLNRLLRRSNLDEGTRVGALRLAGYLSDPELGEAIASCWKCDVGRNKKLREYLWAAAQCCGSDPERILNPICDAWAALPDTPADESSPSPREDLGSHELKWAFQKNVPVSAITYFIRRGQTDDLRWPITIMLDGIDDPDAVEFVTREIASVKTRTEATGSFWPFAQHVIDNWRRRQEEKDRPMSGASRDRLIGIWQNPSTEKHLRQQAFRTWAATQTVGDLEILQSIGSSDVLGESVLLERLLRKDKTAIPELVSKLHGDRSEFWWRLARPVWCVDLDRALEKELEKRRSVANQEWNASYRADYALHEIIMELPSDKAEEILVKNWDHLRFQKVFVQTALYVATPKSTLLAKEALDECPDREKMFEHLSSRYGIRFVGRSGIMRPAQIEALVPYLSELSELDVCHLWEECNARGWFELRRRCLDKRVNPKMVRGYLDESRAMESLDHLVAKNTGYWIDSWIENFLETGVSLDRVITLIEKWLGSRKTIGALRVASMALAHVGRRSDLHILDFEIEPRDEAAAIRLDTKFAVCRRSLQ